MAYTKSWRHGVLTITDGTRTLALQFDGEFKLSIPGVDVIIVDDRGSLPSTPEFVKGAEKPMEASCVANWRTLHSVSEAVLGDFLLGELGAGVVSSTWVSTTNATGAGVASWDIQFTDGVVTFTLEDCVIRGDISEGEQNKINITIICPHPYPTSIT